MNQEIKLCPFCGIKPLESSFHRKTMYKKFGLIARWVHCDTSGCPMYSKPVLVEKRNRRINIK